MVRTYLFLGGAGFVLADAFCYTAGIPVPQDAAGCLRKAGMLLVMAFVLYCIERPRRQDSTEPPVRL